MREWGRAGMRAAAAGVAAGRTSSCRLLKHNGHSRLRCAHCMMHCRHEHEVGGPRLSRKQLDERTSLQQHMLHQQPRPLPLQCRPQQPALEGAASTRLQMEVVPARTGTAGQLAGVKVQALHVQRAQQSIAAVQRHLAGRHAPGAQPGPYPLSCNTLPNHATLPYPAAPSRSLLPRLCPSTAGSAAHPQTVGAPGSSFV